ncbi:MAG: TIGR03936 family radical SAM-associated protein [Lachnospiraceae bacterium]|nr:TIGR03936 family radical SAM-associated protein [Lachnospiraceae bacterium]
MTFRIRFAKYGVVKFIGHLDVMRYFQKVIRRSELPVSYSKGFNPHQIMSFAQPLGVGITSDGEYMEVDFDDEALFAAAGVTPAGSRDIGNGVTVLLWDKKDAPVLEKYVFDGMSAETTEGFEILEVSLLPPPKPNVHTEKAMALVKTADYMVSLKDGYSLGFKDEDEFLARFAGFMEQPEIKVVKKSKKNENEVDIKPLVYKSGGPEGFELSGIAHADEYESGQRVFMKLAAGSIANLRPEPVMEAFCGFIGQEYNPHAFQVHRMMLYLG